MGFFRELMSRLLNVTAKHVPGNSLRVRLQRMRGVQIEGEPFIGMDVHIDNAFPELITIKDRAQVNCGTIMLAHDGLGNYKPVVIEEGAIVGVKTIILPGVTVGKGAIVGAGAVVTKDIPPLTLALGVPAKPIRKIKKEENPFYEGD